MSASSRTLLSDAHVGEYRDTEKLPASRISLRPMRSITRRTWLWLTTATMALYNGVYWERVGGTDAEGVPWSLVPVAPVRITWDGENWRKDGEVIDLSKFVYVPRTSWPTVTADLGTVIRLARDAIAAAWAANAYRADFWQAGGAPVLYISTDQPLTNDQAAGISDAWAERRNTAPGKPAVVGRGGKVETLGADAADAGATDAAERLGSRYRAVLRGAGMARQRAECSGFPHLPERIRGRARPCALHLAAGIRRTHRGCVERRAPR